MRMVVVSMAGFSTPQPLPKGERKMFCPTGETRLFVPLWRGEGERKKVFTKNKIPKKIITLNKVVNPQSINTSFTSINSVSY